MDINSYLLRAYILYNQLRVNNNGFHMVKELIDRHAHYFSSKVCAHLTIKVLSQSPTVA